jgi:hypothetical protein
MALFKEIYSQVENTQDYLQLLFEIKFLTRTLIGEIDSEIDL